MPRRTSNSPTLNRDKGGILPDTARHPVVKRENEGTFGQGQVWNCKHQPSSIGPKDASKGKIVGRGRLPPYPHLRSGWARKSPKSVPKTSYQCPKSLPMPETVTRKRTFCFPLPKHFKVHELKKWNDSLIPLRALRRVAGARLQDKAVWYDQKGQHHKRTGGHSLV